MAKWYSLTNEEADRLNPPEDVDSHPDWLPVGYIQRPATRLGWFVYHLIHGLWMRYPLHKVLGYALTNTRPGELDYRDFPLTSFTIIKMPSGGTVGPDRIEWTEAGPVLYWDTPIVLVNEGDSKDNYVAISTGEVAKNG